MKTTNETIREQIIIKVSKETGIEQKKVHECLSKIIDLALNIKDDLNRSFLNTIIADGYNQLPKELADVHKILLTNIKKGMQL